jgi:sRNA-binding carbon storage regulator CsrA
MLSLTVNVGDEIVIGNPTDPIAVARVTKIRRDGRMQVAFKADRSVEINRRKVAEDKAEKRPATQLGPGGEFVKKWPRE